MAALPDLSNILQASYQGTSPHTLGSATVAAGTGMLIHAVGSAATNVPPTALTWNGLSMNFLGHNTYTSSGPSDVSWWYYQNPPPGTGSVIVTNSSSWTGLGFCHIPVLGADPSRIPALGTGAGATNTAPACSGPGGGASDLYLGQMWTRASAITDNQLSNQLAYQPTINTLLSFVADYLLGSSGGNFSWTVASNDWSAQAITVYSLPPSAYSLESHEYF